MIAVGGSVWISVGLMKSVFTSSLLVAGAVLNLWCGSAVAQQFEFASDDGAFSFSASAGVLALEGREIVYNGTGSTDNLSLLIWQSLSPMISANSTVTLDQGWTIKAEGRAAMSGLGYMEDYDWLTPHRPGFGPEQWTHRSQHPDTRLDWYFDGSVAVGQNFELGQGMKANLHGGFAYTDVQWAAEGGTYLYSNAGFRDNPGTLANGPAITYRQQLPSVFVGLDTQFRNGDLSFDVGARAGITMLARATDWHWQRTPPLRFEDMFMPAPTLGVKAKAAYAVTENLDVFLDARVDKMFAARGDTQTFNMNTGAMTSNYADVAGAELLSGSLSAGLGGRF